MPKMNKYTYCMITRCPKYKEAEAEALKRNVSAIDAASDMWDFVDQCCKTCEEHKKAVADGVIKGE